MNHNINNIIYFKNTPCIVLKKEKWKYRDPSSNQKGEIAEVLFKSKKIIVSMNYVNNIWYSSRHLNWESVLREGAHWLLIK